MVEQKKSHQASHQAVVENSNQRGNPQKTPLRLRKGTFYLWLAVWWPTTKGQKWLTRKGVERRLEAFKESETCAAKA